MTLRRAVVSSAGSDWSWGWTWMMKAEVTAENRPAWDPSQHARTRAMRITYEYQCCVQILVVLLHEFLIVFLGLLAIMFIELGTEILLWQLPVRFLSVRGVNDGGRRNANPSSPIYRAFAWFPVISIPPQYSPMILATLRDRRAVALGFP